MTADKIHSDASNKVTTEGKSVLQTKDSVIEGRNFTIEQDRVTTEAESVLRTADYVIEGRNFTIERGAIVTFSTPLHATLRSGERRSSADSTRAQFDPKNNRLIELVQTGHFEFTEGGRHGSAGRAVVRDGGDTIVLDQSPSVSDSQMKLDAQEIRLNQRTNAFAATGKITTVSTAQPERAQGQRASVPEHSRGHVGS